MAIDLNSLSADDKLRLWESVQRIESARAADPELRSAILRRLDRGSAEHQADIIRHQLDELHPAVVLAEFWAELIDDRPSLGAFPRRAVVELVSVDEWLRAEPLRLIRVVHEMARFSSDRKFVTEQALELADQLGIEHDVADRVVLQALRTLPRQASNAG